jgi:hypothetical protein
MITREITIQMQKFIRHYINRDYKQILIRFVVACMSLYFGSALGNLFYDAGNILREGHFNLRGYFNPQDLITGSMVSLVSFPLLLALVVTILGTIALVITRVSIWLVAVPLLGAAIIVYGSKYAFYTP